MTQIVGGRHDTAHVERILDKAQILSMRPRSAAAKAKVHADRLMHMAAQYEVFTMIGPVGRRRAYKNPPGRIAALIKRAAPQMIKYSGGYGTLLSLSYHWGGAIARALKTKTEPRLYIFLNQVETLKGYAKGAAQ